MRLQQVKSLGTFEESAPMKALTRAYSELDLDPSSLFPLSAARQFLIDSGVKDWSRLWNRCGFYMRLAG
jgi:hypothetical protein